MIAINTDLEKNAILVKIAGTVSVEETNKAIVKMFEIASNMKNNFSIINDLSGLGSISPEQSETLNKVNRKFLDTYQVNKIIRIIGKSRSVLMQLSVSDKKNGIKIIYVPTMKEAIELL